MELDFKTVKALSSPTRIKILNQVLEKEYTPTSLSKEVGKSKSTVSSHLSKLESSGLIEKEAEEGRKRVVYRPTEKGKAIVREKEKKVKFSIVSSTVTGIAGVGLAGSTLIENGEKGQVAGAMMQSMDAMEAGKTAASGGSPENVLLFLGLGFLTVSISSIIYGFLINELGE
ncbi:MAG: winged helix-turn-helix domain-containing protein [Candidatus Nanohaloarchaea archaeon]